VAVSAHQCRDLAMAPCRPVGGVLGRNRLDAIDLRGRPRSLRRITIAQPNQPAPIGTFRNARKPPFFPASMNPSRQFATV